MTLNYNILTNPSCTKTLNYRNYIKSPRPQRLYTTKFLISLHIRTDLKLQNSKEKNDARRLTQQYSNVRNFLNLQNAYSVSTSSKPLKYKIPDNYSCPKRFKTTRCQRKDDALRLPHEFSNARSDFELYTYMEALPQLPNNVEYVLHVRKYCKLQIHNASTSVVMHVKTTETTPNYQNTTQSTLGYRSSNVERPRRQ